MNPADTAIFNEAVSLAQAGSKEVAYRKLKELTRINGNHLDPNLLLWLAFTSPDLLESETAINMAAVQSPASPAIASARKWLVKEKRNQKATGQTRPVEPINRVTTNFSTPTPQVQFSPYESSYPGVNSPLAQPGNPTIDLKKITKKFSIFPIALFLVVIVAIGIIFFIFVFSKPSLPPDTAYTVFPTDRNLVDKAAIGERVRVTATIENGVYEMTLGFNNAYGTNDPCLGGIVLQFDPTGKNGTPSIDGNHVLFGKILERRIIKNPGGLNCPANSVFVVIEVEQIR